MPGLTVIILAAGRGTRMRSRTPKVLHDLCGRPLLHWPIAAAIDAGVERIVVVDSPRRALEAQLPDGVALAVQAEPDGTAGAVRAGMQEVEQGASVVVLQGDVPLISADTITELVGAHTEQAAAATMMTMVLHEPAGYGRVVRDAQGGVECVVETKDPSAATTQQLAIDEVNTGVFAFDGDALQEALRELQPHDAGELYLPDVLPHFAPLAERPRSRSTTATRPSASTTASSSHRRVRSRRLASTPRTLATASRSSTRDRL